MIFHTGRQDFTEIGTFEGFIVFPDSISTGAPRRSCFNVRITDDAIDENMESFTVILELDTFVMQSGIIVSPNITTIVIVDNDGMTVKLIIIIDLL
jgi:hypothetical protein